MRALLSACLAFSISTAWTIRAADLRERVTGEPALEAAPGGTVPVPDRPGQQAGAPQPPALADSEPPRLAAPAVLLSGAPILRGGELSGFTDRVDRPPIAPGL